MKKIEPVKSISGGLKNLSLRPAMKKGRDVKAADRLLSMGFGKRK